MDSPVSEARMMARPAASPPPGPDASAAIALVKGGGELGTAVALALWRAGWRVIVNELIQPTVLRRQLSLAEAAFTGSVAHGGAVAVRVSTVAEAVALVEAAATIPLYLGPLPRRLTGLRPSLVVDARLRRGVPPEGQRGEAAITIGLGPDLVAGQHVDFVIETCPGPDLGRVIAVGAARPHTPLPRSAGHAAEEYVRAPCDGRWHTQREIGDTITQGAVLGWLGSEPLRAPVPGRLRGLVHDAVPVPAGLKLAAVHPGNWQRKEAGIVYRATTIAASVVQTAADALAARPPPPSHACPVRLAAP
jgi:xanthine dehydrogenase accessory factor